jgi:cell division protein ZapA
MPNTEPVRVTIFNQSYSLVATDDAAQVRELAQRVDELMSSIAARAGNIDSARTAVLACLHLADQLRTLERELEDLRRRVENKAQQFTLLLDEAIGVGATAGTQNGL